VVSTHEIYEGIARYSVLRQFLQCRISNSKKTARGIPHHPFLSFDIYYDR